MKQIIRLNTFETNSSSMHSLVVVKDPKPYSENRWIDTLISYAGDEHKHFDLFGCDEGTYQRAPFQILRSQVEKLRYYVAYYIGNLGRKELIPQVIDFIHNETKVPKDKIKITTHTSWYDENENYGYATSNASGTGEDVFDYIEKNNISMEEFVKNPKYVVVVDGDEYQEFKKLFESNILNANDFEYISSGVEFWNDETWEISLYWFENGSMKFITKKSDVNKYVNRFRKNVSIALYDQDEIDLYHKYYKDLEKMFNLIKSEYPNIIFKLKIIKEFKDEMLKENLNIFNQADIVEHAYSDKIAETIKLGEGNK